MGPWQVSTGGGSRPLWARSGLELFYWAPDGAVMSVPVEGGATFTPGAPTRLFQGPYFAGVTGTDYERTYDVSPDGHRFLMIKEGTAGESDTRRRIIVVENWFEELKAKVPTGR